MHIYAYVYIHTEYGPEEREYLTRAACKKVYRSDVWVGFDEDRKAEVIYIYICMYLCIYVCIYMYVCMYVCIHFEAEVIHDICIRICMYACTHACVYVSVRCMAGI